MANKDWWDFSWNPVWGCENTCEYCYARRMAKRYAEQIAKKEIKFYVENHPNWAWTGDHLSGLRDFKPTWLESNYHRKLPKKPSIIFVNSMSDPQYWKQEWYEKTVKVITENEQHTFVMLTKHPNVYKRYFFPINTILGVTCTNQLMLDFAKYDLSDWFKNKRLLSLEPIQEKIQLSKFVQHYFDWVIVGAETGNRKGKIIPPASWIEPFFDLSISVFIKNSLRGIVDKPLRQEWPENVKQ